MNKKIGIFVPARLDSKRLPNKQILPIGDTCMFDICCQKLEYLSKFVNTYVLINDDELIDIASKYPNVKTIIRDKDTCYAETPLVYIFKDVLDVEEDYLMFLNPCLIFLSVETILKKIEEFDNSDKEYGTSAKILQNWIMDENFNVVNHIDYDKLTTKEITPWYQTAHCFHVFNKNKFKEDGLMLKDGFLPLIIPKEETVDIDTFDEYEYAKWLYERNV